MKRKTKGNFYCGTSNIVLPVPNKAFYPEEYREKSRLNYYASIFNSLEVNSSFYKIPMTKTVAKWATDVPDNFVFTFKLWKGITHVKGLQYNTDDINRFFVSVNDVAEKKGCILVQFPASIKFSLFAKVTYLLNDLSMKASDWRIAVEFRDKSWYRDELYMFLESIKATLVQHDMPASAITFPELDTSFHFLRFHGERGDYRGSYADDFLEEYAAHIHDWTQEGKTVFTYFNNTVGAAVHNAITLQQFYNNL